MQGAVAAGSRPTAEAGAHVLAEGGNAVDACIAAVFAAAVAEGPLTGPAGGGFLLAWVDGAATVIDCFFAVPARPLGAMEELVVDFGDASTQVFHVGEGSVAVPGLVAGLDAAHRRFGTVPWADLLEPALELAAAGVETSEAQRVLHLILKDILLHEEAGRAIYGDGRRIETAGFVPLLERLRDVRRVAVAELLPELADEVLGYTVQTPEPLRTEIDRRTVLTAPAPSRGGARRPEKRVQARSNEPQKKCTGLTLPRKACGWTSTTISFISTEPYRWSGNSVVRGLVDSCTT